MKSIASKSLSIALVCVLVMYSVACQTWPTIIAVAQSMAAVTTIVYPSVDKFSALAVNLLQQAEADYKTYEANKSEGNLNAYIAAIQQIETQLPADLAALNIPPADQTKITAVVSIILDFVESEAAQVPATNALVVKARMRRGASALTGHPMTKSQIVARWRMDVCKGDQHCDSLVK